MESREIKLKRWIHLVLEERKKQGGGGKRVNGVKEEESRRKMGWGKWRGRRRRCERVRRIWRGRWRRKREKRDWERKREEGRKEGSGVKTEKKEKDGADGKDGRKKKRRKEKRKRNVNYTYVSLLHWMDNFFPLPFLYHLRSLFRPSPFCDLVPGSLSIYGSLQILRNQRLTSWIPALWRHRKDRCLFTISFEEVVRADPPWPAGGRGREGAEP